jgi:hypothetical protein
VREHAKAGDVICDYDAIYVALSGLPNKVRAQPLDGFVLEAVEKVHDLIASHNELNSWIITATRDRTKVDVLVKRFDAELVALEVSREEAHKRCDADSRPSVWHEFIDKWFEVATTSFVGTGSTKLFLPELPVTAITSVKVDGILLAPTEYALAEDGVLWRNRGVWTVGACIEVEYTHGHYHYRIKRM